MLPGPWSDQRATVPGTIASLVRRASELTGVPVSDLTGPRRTLACAWARSAVVIVGRERGCSFGRIGRVLNRHHTTCMSAVKHGLARIEAEPDFAGLVDALRKEARR